MNRCEIATGLPPTSSVSGALFRQGWENQELAFPIPGEPGFD